MRRLWKKLGWVCCERAESIFFLVLGGLCARLAFELIGAPVNQGMWYLFAALLAGPFVGSLCSAPSFKEVKKVANTDLCTSCWWGIGPGFGFGIVTLATGIPWMSTNTDACIVAGVSAACFASVLWNIAVSKKCAMCAEASSAVCVTQEPEQQCAPQETAGMTPDECERRIRAYLEDGDNAFRFLMQGMYATDIAAAIGAPYSLVASVLDRTGSTVYVRLINQSLVLRDYGYPAPL